MPITFIQAISSGSSITEAATFALLESGGGSEGDLGKVTNTGQYYTYSTRWEPIPSRMVLDGSLTGSSADELDVSIAGEGTIDP